MLMRARVEPHSYTEHSPTDLSIKGLHGEPENSEFRIQSNDNQRVESSRVTLFEVVLLVYIDIHIQCKIQEISEEEN